MVFDAPLPTRQPATACDDSRTQRHRGVISRTRRDGRRVGSDSAGDGSAMADLRRSLQPIRRRLSPHRSRKLSRALSSSASSAAQPESTPSRKVSIAASLSPATAPQSFRRRALPSPTTPHPRPRKRNGFTQHRQRRPHQALRPRQAGAAAIRRQRVAKGQDPGLYVKTHSRLHAPPLPQSAERRVRETS